MTVKAVCWDWNGTLLDDVARCLRVMNLMLADFGRPRIADAVAYRAAVDQYLELLTADTTDAHRASKRDVIAAWLEGTGYEPADVLLIGDTDHDLEIARELGTRFVHFEGGHQALSDGDVVSIRALGQLERVLDG